MLFLRKGGALKRSIDSPRLVMLVALGAVFIMTVPAEADVVGPPPTNCPDGTEPMSSHQGAYCHPMRCSTNADCDRGGVCAETSLCLGKREIWYRYTPPEKNPPTHYEIAEGTCPNGACSKGICTKANFCMPTLTDDIQRVRQQACSGCSCRVAQSGSSSLIGGFLVAGLLIGFSLWRRFHSMDG